MAQDNQQKSVLFDLFYRHCYRKPLMVWDF